MSVISLVPSGGFSSRSLFPLFPKDEKESEKVTLRETRDSYLVIAEFPGFIKDDIHIQLHNGVLNIYASSYLGSRHFHEKRKIHRTVALQRAVEEKQMRYLYEKNVLKIWIPKKPHAKSFNFLNLNVLRKLIRRS